MTPPLFFLPLVTSNWGADSGYWTTSSYYIGPQYITPNKHNLILLTVKVIHQYTPYCSHNTCMSAVCENPLS